jgi:hypothetical protein
MAEENKYKKGVSGPQKTIKEKKKWEGVLRTLTKDNFSRG